MPDQKLTLRHDAGNSALPYVDGALLAVCKVPTLVGLHRGWTSCSISETGARKTAARPAR